MQKQLFQNLLFVIGIILVIALSLFLYKAPKALPASSPSTTFSAERAFEHTKQIAKYPHPVGSLEHNMVREYIVHELLSLGLDVSFQNTTSVYDNRVVRAASIKNIVAVLKGTESKHSILVLGHYDSEAHTLGAADDGSAIVAMLEAARALKEGESLKNDVIFLYTDAEELGLFGAKAFVEEHELTDHTGIVLNLDTRGSSGPGITFEVSPDNGWIMREYIKSVPHSYASSVMYEVYKMLPNNTDFTLFKNAGLSGFNIAFVEDYVNYHTMTDSPENLNLNSLQHHGSYIMSIVNHFGNMDLSNTKSDDLVYFNIVGSVMMFYPKGLNLILCIIVTLLMIASVYLGIKHQRLSIKKILLGALVFILSIVITIGIIWLIKKGIKALYPHYSNFYDSNFYNIKFYFLAFAALSIAIFSVVYVYLHKWLKTENLLFGVLVVNLILLFALLFLMPTASYLAIVPLLFILIAYFICLVFKLSFENKLSIFLIIQFIALFPVISLIVPNIKMMFIIFGLDLTLPAVTFTIILLGYFSVVLKSVIKFHKWALPVSAFVIGLIGLIGGHFTSDYSEDQPLQSNIYYCYNHDTNKALWVSDNLDTDEWNSQFFDNAETAALTEIYPHAQRTRLKNRAPEVSIGKPEIKVLIDTIIEGQRKLDLYIYSTRKAGFCEIYIDEKSQLSDLKVNKKQIKNKDFYEDPNEGSYVIYYYGMYNEGVEITLLCDTDEPFEIFIVEYKLGIPEIDSYEPKPDYIIPQTGFGNYFTMIKCTWSF